MILSLVAAITKKGVLCFRIWRGILRSNDFSSFLLDVIDSLIRQGEDVNDYVFVIDQASQHYFTYASFMKNIIYYIYRPRKGCILMPIENVFSIWKAHCKRMTHENEDMLVYNVFQASKFVTPQKCINCIDHCFRFFEKCIYNEDFD